MKLLLITEKTRFVLFIRIFGHSVVLDNEPSVIQNITYVYADY